jgi:hypothetical protein
MKFLPIPVFFLLTASLLSPQFGLRAEEVFPDAAALVREVRFSQAEQSFDLTGELSKGRKKVPFSMSMIKELDMIRFRFTKPTQIISLVLLNNRYVLTEQVAGQPAKELDQKRYGERIRGTDVTYEDISQRFLYWDKAVVLGSEKLRITVLRDCWVVRLDNPRRGLGPYAVVKIWIDKESKALLQVEGFDWLGSKVKRFEVVKVQKDKDVGIWLLEKMRVETIDQKDNRKEKTLMEMDKPVRRK